MNVSELQQFFGSLVELLRASGASSKAVGEIEAAREGLTPFARLTVAEFADFLGRAREYYLTGIIPAAKKSSRSRARKADPQAVQEAVQRMRDLCDRATDPSLTYGEIQAEVKKIGKAFTKPDVEEIARGLDIAGKPKTKKAALEEIERKIANRKESYERTRF